MRREAEVLNGVWAFSIERERWTLLSGESTTTDGERSSRVRSGIAGVPKSATWIDAPDGARTAACTSPAPCDSSEIASAPAACTSRSSVYLSATAAEHARDRGAVFSSVGKLRETAETPATSPPDPPPPARARGRTLAGLEPPPADTLNASLDINTEDGGDQGARLTALQGLRWIDGDAGRKKRKEETPAPPPPAGADADAGVEAGAEAADAKTPSPDASTDFEFGGEGDVDVGVGKYRDEIGAAMAHIAATGRLKSSKRRAPPGAEEGSPIAKPTTSARTEDLPPTVIKPRRNRALPRTSGPRRRRRGGGIAGLGARREAAARRGGRAAGRGGGRGDDGGGKGGRGRGRRAKPASDAPVPEAHWLAPDAVKPIAAPGVRVVSRGPRATTTAGGDSENAGRSRRRGRPRKAAAAAERAARLRRAARAAAEAAAAAAGDDGDDDDNEMISAWFKRFWGRTPVVLDDTSTAAADPGEARWSALSVGPTPPSLEGGSKRSRVGVRGSRGDRGYPAGNRPGGWVRPRRRRSPRRRTTRS